MKKSAFVFSLFLGILFIISLAFAEDSYGPPSDGEPRGDYERSDYQRDDYRRERMDRGSQEEGGRRGSMGESRGKMGEMKMGAMKGGMMGMHQQSVVATSDGGVVILSGGKLAKYDANLNLVNEVEIKKDKTPKHSQNPEAAAESDELPRVVAPSTEEAAPSL